MFFLMMVENPSTSNAPALLPERQRNLTAALCWLGWVFDFYDLIIVAFLITTIETALNIGPELSPWLIGVGLGASGLGGVFFGALADRYGRKPILTVTIILFSLGTFATGFVQTADQFLLARFITGLGLGGEWAVGHALLAESVPPKNRGKWSAVLQSGEPVGVGIAALMGFLVASHIGWRMVFILSSATGLLVLLFRPFLSESPMWLAAPPKRMKERFREMLPFFKQYKALMLLAFVMATLKLGTYWTCYTWLPRFISESFGVALGKSTLWILMGQAGQFIGMYLFGVMADQVGRRWAFTLFSLITASALLPLAIFWTSLFDVSASLFWILIFLMGLGSGCTAGFGALLAELFPTEQRTFAMGVVYNMARGMQLFSPVIVGMAVSGYGLTGGLLVPTLLAVLTACWVWTLPEKKGHALA